MSVLKTYALAGGALLLAFLTSAAGSPGVRPGTAQGAELVKTGWWWVANETPLDETVIAPPQSSPPNVPKGTLPVAAAGGDPEKLTALEFALKAGPGAFVEQATLVLRENGEPGATVNAENAVVLACPVTEGFWADGSAGAWKARPSFDCDLASAAGQRDAKGLWTFDLTAIASLWVAEGHRGSTAVALVEGVDAPESYQVAFDGPASEGVGYRFVTSTGSTGAPPLGGTTGGGSVAAAPDAKAGSGSDPGGAFSPGGVSSASVSGGGAELSAPLTGSADVAPVAGELGAGEAAPPATAGPASAPTMPVAAITPAWYSGMPKASVLLLPLVLGLGYLMMLALGPDAQPAGGPSQRGVGRALERLRRTGAHLAARRRG